MNIKHFYAVWVNYLPNSAPSNRMLAYLNAWSKMDIDITVVFFLPDRSFSKVPYHYSNIHFEYLWDRIPTRIRIIHYLLYGLYIKRFIRNLNAGDRIYVYSQANLLPKLLKKEGLCIYHETTEHPAVVPLGVKFHMTTIDTYLDCCRRLNGLFVITTFLKNYFTENGVEPGRLEIVNMVVDPSRFNGVEKQNKRKYIAYCGNASNNKDGVDRLIRAFAIISDKYKDIYLYIIGKAPNNKEEDSNGKLAEELGVSDRVIFTGTVNYHELPQMLKNASMLALARPDSLQSKNGFPTKLGEYLLSSNPVVVTDTGDISRFLKDKENAMIAKSDSVEDFAEKMEWLFEHPKEALLIGSKGRIVAMESFNANIEANKIVDFIFRQ